MNKKEIQLGMKPQTAGQRLNRDLIWHYIASQTTCFRCKEPMTRQTFSVDHMTNWLDSDDPVGLYFDLDNISFSHGSCNKGARRGHKGDGVTPDQKRVYNAEYYQKNKDKWKYKPSRAAYMREYNRKKK